MNAGANYDEDHMMWSRTENSREKILMKMLSWNLPDSIKQFGILQPLIVQKRNDYYEIIAGERRWRAAKHGRYQRDSCYH